MVDEDGDGGYVKRSYPTDETVIHEDATAETARVDEVRVVTCRYSGTL